MRVFYDKDGDIGRIRSKKVAVIGYGSQGHAHAANLRDSGVEQLVVGLRADSTSRLKAQAAGFRILDPESAAAWAELIMILVPDELQAALYRDHLAPGLSDGKAMAFAHGFNIHFKLIEPRSGLDVFMVAPKGPGHTVRASFERGGGVPCLLAVHQDASGKTHDLALSYACAVGGGRAGVIETTFREECETDLFGEQSVLCGGMVQMILAAFDTLVESGYSPEMAYFECMHEVKLIVDLFYEGGLGNMLYSISNTAEYGAYVRGPRLVDDRVRAQMRQMLEEIQTGQFASEWMKECQVGQPKFKALRRRIAEHPIEQVGERLRAMMPWLSSARMVDRSKN